MDPKARRGDGYHHGDLRRALLDAAMDLVRERGIDGLTLREVARRAGVSHAAPYHHFPDRAAVVSALAVEAFVRFESGLRDAAALTPGTHLARIRAIGRAYVHCAVDDPARFALMWRPELRAVGDGSPVDQAGLASYQVLIDEIVAGQETGEIIAADTGLLSAAAWATVHGLATLAVDGPLRDEARTWSREEPVVEATLDLAIRGLAAPGHGPTRPEAGSPPRTDSPI